jgi:hypothetical protein
MHTAGSLGVFCLVLSRIKVSKPVTDLQGASINPSRDQRQFGTVVFWRVGALLLPCRLDAVIVTVHTIGTNARFRAVHTRQAAIAAQFLVATAIAGNDRSRSLARFVSCIVHGGSAILILRRLKP